MKRLVPKYNYVKEKVDDIRTIRNYLMRRGYMPPNDYVLCVAWAHYSQDWYCTSWIYAKDEYMATFLENLECYFTIEEVPDAGQG